MWYDVHVHCTLFVSVYYEILEGSNGQNGSTSTSRSPRKHENKRKGKEREETADSKEISSIINTSVIERNRVRRFHAHLIVRR